MGLGADGTTKVANTGNAGIVVTAGAAGTRIGTDGNGVADAEKRNVISGNSQEGIQVEGTGTTGTVIAGNYIGTTAREQQPLATPSPVFWSGRVQPTHVSGRMPTE